MEIAAPAPAVPTTARRVRFRESLRNVAARSTADDLVRWMLIPASLLVIVGFNFMIFGWIGAANTVRQIEQIPYLISGGLIGLALVFLGGLLLASTFWIMVVRKLTAESEARTQAQLAALESRLEELSSRRPPLRARQ
jgi:hypothetical protein